MSSALVLHAPEEQLEIVAAELFERGALGVELQDRDLLPMPGTPPLPEGLGRCVAHFGSQDDAREAALGLREAHPELEVPEPVPVEEQDWSRAWRAHHRALKVGPRSWVHPPWEPPALGPSEVAVAIDPGMAFGTGSHPTTSLCLARVDELLAAGPGADVLDVGTGSGVIALLAARLDAGRVCGTENDPVALRAAQEATALNGLPPGRIAWELRDPDALPPPYDAPYGIVVANILLNTLVELAAPIAAKVAPGGHLALAGLLSAQAAEVERAYAARGLVPAGRVEREGWVRVDLARPPPSR